jgi:hypothetical protein
MGAKVYADCLSDEGAVSSPDPALPPDVAALPEDACHDGASAHDPRPSPWPAAEASEERSEETEVQAIAAWFEALPDEWRSYFDREAESGQRAYGQA